MGQNIKKIKSAIENLLEDDDTLSGEEIAILYNLARRKDYLKRIVGIITIADLMLAEQRKRDPNDRANQLGVQYSQTILSSIRFVQNKQGTPAIEEAAEMFEVRRK